MDVCMKYAPRSFRPNEYIGNRRAVVEVAKWMAHHFGVRRAPPTGPSLPGAPPPPKPPGKILLLSGSPGVGKTTAVRLLCAQYGLAVVECNGSDDRSAAFVSDTVSSVCGSCTNVRGVKSILVFEEADGLTVPAAALLLKLGASVTRPVICVCNNPYAAALRGFLTSDHVTHIKFHKVKWQDMTQRIIDLFHSMGGGGGGTITSSMITDIGVSSNGDMRRCVHLIKMATLKGIPRTLMPAGRGAADRTYTPFEACTLILSKKAALDMRAEVASKEPRMAQFVRKNYIRDGKDGDSQDLDSLAQAANKLSIADIFDRCYELPRAYSEYAIAGAGMHARQQKKETFFFAQMPDDYTLHNKTEAVRQRVDVIATSKGGLSMFTARTVATELLPILRHPDTLEQVATSPAVGAWFAQVGEEYGLDAMRDEADDIKQVAAEKSNPTNSFAMEGFRRAEDENRQPLRHIYFAEMVRETAFGNHVSSRSASKRKRAALESSELRSAPQPPPQPQPTEEAPGGESASTLPAHIPKSKAAVAKSATGTLRNITLDGTSGGVAVIKQRKAPVRGPVFKEKDARRIHKITSFFQGGTAPDPKNKQ